MPINGSVGFVKGIGKERGVDVGNIGVAGISIANGFGRFRASLIVLERFKNNLISFGGVL